LLTRFRLGFKFLLRMRFFFYFGNIFEPCAVRWLMLYRKRLSTRYVFDCLTFNPDRIVLFNDKRYIMLRLFVLMVSMVTPRAYHIIIYYYYCTYMGG